MNAARTRARDATIKRLIKEKRSVAAIAARLGCCERTVLNRVRQLGLPVFVSRPRWITTLDEQLKELALAGKSGAQAAAALGVTRNAALARAAKLGVPFRHPRGGQCQRAATNKRFLWNDAAFAKLDALVAAGETSKSSAKKLGACLSSVLDHARRRGLKWQRTNYAPVKQVETPREPVAARPVTAEEERKLIIEFAQHQRVRRFEPGATGDTSHLIDWLVRVCGRDARRLSSSGGHHGRIYQVDGKKHDLDGLIAIVDEERVNRGLQPFKREAA